MPISIFLVNSAELLERVFELRYDVYVNEEGRFPPHPSLRIFDRFDCYPGTFSVLAVDSIKGQAVGTVRFAINSSVGLPSDSFYDFKPYLEGLEGEVATMGMLAVRRHARFHRGVVTGLLKIAWRELRRAGARHIVAPVSPDAETILRGMGAKQVGDPFDYGDPPVRMTPIHLDVHNLTPGFREESMDPQGILFERFHERRLYRRGEVVLRAGEVGDAAFLIMRGTAEVEAMGGATQTSYVLGPGEIFGELALLDGDSHTVTVRAASRMLDVAVVPRQVFQDRLSSDAEFGRRMLKILGQRVRRLLANVAPHSMTEVNQEALVASILLDASCHGTAPVERKWLASDCGLTERRLADVLGRWYDLGVVRRTDHMLEVVNPTALQVVVDHVVDSYILAESGLEAGEDGDVGATTLRSPSVA